MKNHVSIVLTVMLASFNEGMLLADFNRDSFNSTTSSTTSGSNTKMLAAQALAAKQALINERANLAGALSDAKKATAVLAEAQQAKKELEAVIAQRTAMVMAKNTTLKAAVQSAVTQTQSAQTASDGLSKASAPGDQNAANVAADVKRMGSDLLTVVTQANTQINMPVGN